MSAKETNEDEVIKYMVGRELTQRYPEMKREAKETMLEVEHLNLTDPSGHQVVKDVSFSVRAGEIVGLAGLMGAGRTETISSVFGAVKGKVTGTIKIEGKEVQIHSPLDAICQGMAFLSEDRKRYGLIQGQSISKNISISSMDQVNTHGVINLSQEYDITRSYAKSSASKRIPSM